MAGFAADAALAGMTRRAHDILAGRGVMAGKGGDSLIPGQPPRPTAPTAMYRQMVDTQRARSISALQGLMSRTSGQFDVLRVNQFRAPSSASIASMAQMAAQRAAVDRGDINQNQRWTDQSLIDAAHRMAADRGWIAHQAMDEGRVDPLGPDPSGRHYKMVKFWTPQGFSTEKVFI